MDLLFKRYASPFILLDNLISTSSLKSFIDEFIDNVNKEEHDKILWEFFLHKVYDKSWREFVEEINDTSDNKEINLGATLNKSKDMLNNFTPD